MVIRPPAAKIVEMLRLLTSTVLFADERKFLRCAFAPGELFRCLPDCVTAAHKVTVKVMPSQEADDPQNVVTLSQVQPQAVQQLALMVLVAHPDA